jgi:hypothetical protein
MSELSVQNEVQNKCFICSKLNDIMSINIPCLNNHTDKIHKECYYRYSKTNPNCRCGNIMHIPRGEHESIMTYWDNCCEGFGILRPFNQTKHKKIVHGLVIFTDFMTGEKVTKEFKVTGDSIDGMRQYTDENASMWDQPGPSLITIGCKHDCFTFCHDAELVIFSATLIEEL